MKSKDVYVSQPRRPFLHRVLAAFFFTGVLFCVGLFIKFIIDNRGLLLDLIYIATLLFSLAIGFSIEKEYFFDYKNKKYRVLNHVGPISWGSWKQFMNEAVMYISVFKRKENHYEIKLFYDFNKRMPLAFFEDYKSAIKIGKELAIEIELNLWDATDPRNGFWVDLNENSPH